MSSKARVLDFAKENLEWFVLTEEPMTREESLAFLVRVAEYAYDMGVWDGKIEQVEKRVGTA